MSIRKSTTFVALLILCLSFLSIHANKCDEGCSDVEEIVEDLAPVDESACYKSMKHNKAEAVLDKNKKLDFYVGVSGGKAYSDNSELFIKGMQEIGKRILTLVESSYGPMVKNIVAGEIQSIQQFKGEINFQWLGAASLGCCAGENGRVDFETMYSKVNITQGNNAIPIFDKSAGIFTFLLNFYYNPTIQNTQFAPYVGLGIGTTIFRLKKVNGANQDLMPLNVPWFAYQVKFGVDYSIIPEIKTFLGYRYFSIPMPVADDIATHNIEVGLLFNFYTKMFM